MCNNLVIALEYVGNNKLNHYQESMGSLEYLFHILHQNALQIQKQFDSEQIDKNEHQKLNIELEGHIENLECELEKGKVYQTSYFEQNKKFDLLQD
jgi:hypothetical protein